MNTGALVEAPQEHYIYLISSTWSAYFNGSRGPLGAFNTRG